MSDRSNLISDLYHAALERPPEQRADFLNEACKAGDGLRQEVESLLRVEPASAGFLETSPAPLAAVALREHGSRDLLGGELDPYKMTRTVRRLP